MATVMSRSFTWYFWIIFLLFFGLGAWTKQKDQKDHEKKNSSIREIYWKQGENLIQKCLHHAKEMNNFFPKHSPCRQKLITSNVRFFWSSMSLNLQQMWSIKRTWTERVCHFVLYEGTGGSCFVQSPMEITLLSIRFSCVNLSACSIHSKFALIRRILLGFVCLDEAGLTCIFHKPTFGPVHTGRGSTYKQKWNILLQTGVFTQQGPIHTGRGMRRAMRCKQMGPIDVNGSIHTACKQHQRKNVRIYAHVASRVLCGLGLRRKAMQANLCAKKICFCVLCELGLFWGYKLTGIRVSYSQADLREKDEQPVFNLQLNYDDTFARCGSRILVL